MSARTGKFLAPLAESACEGENLLRLPIVGWRRLPIEG